MLSYIAQSIFLGQLVKLHVVKKINKKILEQDNLCEYSLFLDKGKFHTSNIAYGYKKIKVQTVFDIKYDYFHKAQCVANDHLIDTLEDNIYSRVISLQSFWMVFSSQS